MSHRATGIASAVAAYVLWGILPVYWKQLETVSAVEILAHRIVWAFAFLVVLTSLRGEWGILRSALKKVRTLRVYGTAAALLGLNWGIYIWAVNSDQIVETSLGYYINPLVSLLLAVGVLRERLRRVQWLAVTVAGAGVAQLTYGFGGLPWIALALAVSFALYGLVKKLSPLGPIAGLTVETLVLLPLALAYLAWRHYSGQAAFGDAGLWVTGLLAFAGVVTSLPLLLFARAAQAIPLSTVGLLQYIAPSCALWIGVFGYGEPFPAWRVAGFALIWAALALYWIEASAAIRNRTSGSDRFSSGRETRPR